MTQIIANVLIRGGAGTRFWFILIALVAGAIIFEGICEQTLRTWIKRTRGRNWPAVSAVVDIVSVASCEDDSLLPTKADLSFPYYLATLTYTYNNPEKQMGEYRRRFGDEDDAKSWANSYKGETVKVHVDPRDPTRSVLREEDL
ncbi:MAG TPA: DUF3592 domain-containing protein [Acidobacteriaceae bacterium]|nr:DUF3592 domain-containing protein [Acidobacteriaceae bacterium]